MSRVSKSKRLELVVNLAKRKREEADAILLDARQRLEQAERGLRQLEVYLDEYLEQSRLASGQQVDVSLLQTQAAFIGRLRGSIRQQKEVIVQTRNQFNQVQTWWQELYARERALTQLRGKALDAELLREDKALQKQIDELSQRRRPNFI